MKRVYIILGIIASILIIPITSQASTSAEATSLAQVLQNTTLSGYNAPFGSDNFPEESISPIDGSVTLVKTDLYLPGKNGLDFKLKRVHNNISAYKGYSKTSSRRDSTSTYAYRYRYTLNDGKTGSVYVAFASETQMLSLAPNGFYSTQTALDRSLLKDSDGNEFTYYSRLYEKNGDIWLARDLSDNKLLYFEKYSRLSANCYDSPYDVGMNWRFVLPYIYADCYGVGGGEYEGFGTFMDYDGESHVIEVYYERDNSQAEYTYSGSITINDSASMKGYVENKVYPGEPDVEYFFRITDGVGRTMYFDKKGRIRIVEDRFGNTIKFYYNNFSISKVIDSVGREILIDSAYSAVTVNPDGNGGFDKRIEYNVSNNNNDVLDPDDLLICDDYGTFTVSEIDPDGTRLDTVYDYQRSETAYCNSSSSYDCCYQVDGYDILSIHHPNGLITKFDYELVERECDTSFHTIARRVSGRSDIDGDAKYNHITYDYGADNTTTPVVTETNNSFGNVVTTYTLQLNSPSHISQKKIDYGVKYYEQYSYPTSISSHSKMNLLKVIKSYVSSSAGYGDETAYEYSSNRLWSIKRNNTESTVYTHYYNTDFIKTKIYSIDTKRYIKEEYILNDKEGDDNFKNRNVIRTNVYESTDDKKTYTLKETTDFTYDEYGNMSSITHDPEGNPITSSMRYTYENGNIISETISPEVTLSNGSLGNITTSSVIDNFGQTIEQTDGNGKTAYNSYDSFGHLVRSSDPLGSTDKYEYDVPKRTLVHTAKNGQKTKILYDAFGKVKTAYKMYNGEYLPFISYEYNGAGYPKKVTEYISYNGSTCSQKLVTKYTWYYIGKVSKKVVTDISGNIVLDETYNYSYGATLPSTSSSPTLTHDAKNNEYKGRYYTITLTRPTKDGITPPTVKEYYDVKDRMVKRITTDGDNEYYYTCIYDHRDNILEEKDEYAYFHQNPLDYSKKTVYDYKGNPVEVYNAEGHAVTYVYDKMGNLVSETDPMGNTKTYVYDELGRMTSKSVPFTDSQTSVTYYTYDGNGNLLKERIPTASRTQSYTYDALNRPVSAYDGRYYTKYLYDVMGNVTKSVSGLSSSATDISSYAPSNSSYTVVNYTYDSFGNNLTKTDALGTTTYTYDFSGRQLTVKDPKGFTTTNTYTPTGLIEESYTAGSDLITNTYDFWGNLISTERGSYSTHYFTYDNMGNMVKETAGTTIKDYTYDGVGSLLNFTLTYKGAVIQDADYTYDIMGRMASVSDGTDNVTYTYNANGSLTEQVNGELKTYYGYNNAGLLTDLSNKRERIDYDGETVVTSLSDFTYTHRTDGNIAAMTDGRNGKTAQNNRYSYYNNGELSLAYLGSDTYDYTTNNRGNRTSSYIKGADNVYHRTYNTYTSGNRLSSSYSYDSTDTSARYDVASYTYDANGNTTREIVDGVSASKYYGFRNELIEYTKGDTEITYTYGADGLRTSKKVNGVRTNYIWSGGNIVAEITGDKIVTYLYGLNRISRKISGPGYSGTYVERDPVTKTDVEITVDFYHECYVYDGHGNVVQLYNAGIDKYITKIQWGTPEGGIPVEFDTNGDGCVDVMDLSKFLNTYPLTQSYYYDAFGNHLGEEKSYDSNPFRYCGEYWDKETGEVYLRARYYNPKIGRFTSVDPAMDGNNWYVYCGGNPIAFVDPWGLAYGNYNRLQNIVEGIKDITLLGWRTTYRGGYEIANKARDMGIEYAKTHNSYSNGVLVTWDNEADAFRHFSWNSMMQKEIGSTAAGIIGFNHELETWDKDKLDGGSKYKVYYSSLMDMNNNSMGIKYAEEYPTLSEQALFNKAKSNGDIIDSLDDVPSFYGLQGNQIHEDKNGKYIELYVSDDKSDIHIVEVLISSYKK